MQPNASPRDQNNIDPAISGASMLAGPPPQTPPQQDPSGPESPKSFSKRPLSTSKRAAQNRAAQRAFRQRKETYIRKLEDQVKDFENMSDGIKTLQTENYQLREYIINLQSRLLDTQGEVPELPGNIDLSQPRTEMQIPPAISNPNSAGPAPTGNPQQQPQPHQNAAASNDDMNSLNRIAVAGLGMRKPPNEDPNYLANSQFQNKRLRGDEGQHDPDVTKTEPTHGLPVVS